MKPNVTVIHARDNVAIALADIAAGAMVIEGPAVQYAATGEIPYSHKVAREDITEGADIRKYGEVIGQAGAPIRRGEWVHTHNITFDDAASGGEKK